MICNDYTGFRAWERQVTEVMPFSSHIKNMYYPYEFMNVHCDLDQVFPL